MRNIFNEIYSRDISKKIKSSLRLKGKSGGRLTSIPIYGYKLDPDNKNNWIVDGEAAESIRLIYKLAVQNKGPSAIARELQDKNILTPAAYMAAAGFGRFKNASIADKYRWNAQSVKNILEMPEYMGHTVNFKTCKISYKTRAKLMTPREDWLVFEDTHGAIIDKDTWEAAQKSRRIKRRNRLTKAGKHDKIIYNNKNN